MRFTSERRLDDHVLEREVTRARVQLEHVALAVGGQRVVVVQLTREREDR